MLVPFLLSHSFANQSNNLRSVFTEETSNILQVTVGEARPVGRRLV